MAGDKHPEWLPVDWKVEERKRFGRKRKWYIAPKEGLKFFSKPQVLRYLNEDVNTTQQQQTEVVQDKVTAETTVAKKLPLGWIKETQTRRDMRKKDTFYIDPVTKRKFRSMPSVLRYLEAKEGDEDHIGVENNHSQSSPTEAEGKILIEDKGDAEGNTAESEPSPANDGAEHSIHQNELQDISVDDYLIETCIIDFLVEPPQKDIQMDKSGETSVEGSSSELPPGDFFNVPWFPPAYKLIVDEISVGTYVQQTSTSISVPLQG